MTLGWDFARICSAYLLSPVRIFRPNMPPTLLSQRVSSRNLPQSPRLPACSLLICFLLYNAEVAIRFVSSMSGQIEIRSVLCDPPAQRIAELSQQTAEEASRKLSEGMGRAA